MREERGSGSQIGPSILRQEEMVDRDADGAGDDKKRFWFFDFLSFDPLNERGLR